MLDLVPIFRCIKRMGRLLEPPDVPLEAIMSLSTFPMLRPINRVQNFGRFHISHNPSSASYGCDTTALVLNETVFLVLNGSHIKAMKDAASLGGIATLIKLRVF